MSALRLSTPAGGVKLGPQEAMAVAPLRGYSHHGHSVTGGSFVRALPSPSEPVRVTVCGMCGEPLPARRGPVGRVPQWCSQACRSGVTASILLPNESPEDALRRLERLPGPQCTAALESEAGQRLLAVLRERARAARRLTRRKGVT